LPVEQLNGRTSRTLHRKRYIWKAKVRFDLIDAMVYELYFPDEIKAAGCEVLKHPADLPELKNNWNDEQKLAAIEKVHRELSDPSHPVSIAMKKMQDIPEIRII